MKSRWMNHSLRIRISPTELETLLQGQAVVERLHPESWGATLVAGPRTVLTLEGADAIVQLSRPDLDRLLDPETEGVYFESAHEPPIKFFVEKDFPCLHDRPPGATEPDTETFEAPRNFRARHGS